MTTHTKGPLFVSINEKWPFDIETKTADGNVVFTRHLPCHSSADKSANDALHCLNFKANARFECEMMNQIALKDEVLRAAAPELLDALIRLYNSHSLSRPPGSPKSDSQKQAEAAIAKATGETP